MAQSAGKTGSLPLDFAEIDAAWLTSALSIKWPGVTVRSFEVLTNIVGTTTVVRLRVDTDNPAVPPTMCLKGGFNENSRLNINALIREARLYQWALTQENLRMPECYYAAIDLDNGQGIVLIEDLIADNVHFFDPAVGLTVEDVRSGLEFFSDLHSRLWNKPPLDTGESHGGSLRKDNIGRRLFSEESWADAMSRSRASGLNGKLRDRDTVWDAVRRAYKANYLSGDTCLLHGDPHPGNSYRRTTGQVGYYDWQRSMHGPWVHDVAYLMAASLSLEDRRAHERDLLNFYLERLRSNGVDAPSFDQAFEKYRLEVIQPLMWVVTPTGTQSEAAIELVSGRIAAAVTDLDSLAALPGG